MTVSLVLDREDKAASCRVESLIVPVKAVPDDWLRYGWIVISGSLLPSPVNLAEIAPL